MLLRAEEVVQAIDGEHRARFVKEVHGVEGAAPLAMVRKRLPEREVPGARYLAPVMLAHGFGQNRYAWHLSGRSFANYLAREGFDVFNLELRGHGRSRLLGSSGAHSADDYIRDDLPRALAEVLAVSGARRAFVLGHSLGGMIAYAAAAGLAGDLAGLVTIGSPYRFGRGSSTLTAFARLLGLLAGDTVSSSRALPIRAVGLVLRAQRALWNARYMPLPVRIWSPGTMEPTLLREYLLRTFDGATTGTLLQLARFGHDGRFLSGDGRDDYGAMFEGCQVPLMVIAGKHDLLAPPDSVRPAFDRARTADKTYREIPFGHADLLLGRDAIHTTWPIVAEWMRARVARARDVGSAA